MPLRGGVFPILFASRGLSVQAVGVLTAIYPAVWAFGQLATGALSDTLGRKPLVVGGMLVQSGGLAMVAGTRGFAPWVVGAAVLGLGTATVYPTLLAAVGDVAHPAWRASAIGVYRFWRDAGFAVGGLVAGVTADLVGLRSAIWLVAALTAVSGLVAAARMYETLPARRRAPRRRRLRRP